MTLWDFLSDESRPDMDEVSMLTAVTLFLLSAGTEVVGVTSLQKGCMDRFRNALNSSDPWVMDCNIAELYSLIPSVLLHVLPAPPSRVGEGQEPS